MRTRHLHKALLLTGILGISLYGCGKSDGGGAGKGGNTSTGGTTGSGGATTSAGGSGGTTTSANGSGGTPPGGASGSGSSGGARTTGGTTSGGSTSTGGTVASGGSKGSGGAQGTGGATPGAGGASAGTGGAGTGAGGVTAGTGGASTGKGGASAGTGGRGTGGAGTGGQGGGVDAADPGSACTVGAWPAADPAVAGAFATVTENNVGPVAGVAVDGGAPPQFTMFRPKDMAQGGLCHPVVTWGNGTGSTPSLYKVLLNQLASHGFVVIASNSTNVAQGTPAPMVAGVTWVLQQNDDPTSVLYQRIDTTHIGATGHSQGGFATTTAGADSHITTIAPLCGASTQKNLHGPAFLYCGGMDTTVPCSNIQTAFNGITNQPVMLAEYLSADHANWITFYGTTLSPVEITVVAWMRVQLMGDTALRSWFYGSTCKLCQDTAWQVTQKTMDP